MPVLGANAELFLVDLVGDVDVAGGVASAVAGPAGGQAGAGCVQRAAHHHPGEGVVALEDGVELGADDPIHHVSDATAGEAGLGLALEAGLRHLYGNDGGETFAGVVAGYGEVLVLDQVVGLGVIVDFARGGGICMV